MEPFNLASRVQPDPFSPGAAVVQVTLDQWVTPDLADNRGYLQPGVALEWMDVAASLVASRYCRTPVLTVAIDNVDLRSPVAVGRALRLSARVVHTSSRSLGVAIDVMSDGDPVMGAYMTFVSIDEQRKVLAVRSVEPQTTSERECYQEGERWKEFRKQLLAGAVPQLPRRWTRQKATGPLGRASDLLRGLPDALSKSLLQLRNNGAPDRRRLSYVHSVEPVRVDELTFHGTLHDGTVVGWIGRSAEESAKRWLDNEPVRLIGLHGLTYLRPARANYCVHVHSLIVHTDQRSVTALVEVYAEDPVGGDVFQTLRALMSYAPLRPCAIAEIGCVDAGERALYAQVVQQLAMQRISRRTARSCLWSEAHRT